jgi:hypothetical protein
MASANTTGHGSTPRLNEKTVLALLCAGLDSFAALVVMGYLQDLAASTRQTVIATIYQPRSAIWGMFDKVRCTLAVWQVWLVDKPVTLPLHPPPIVFECPGLLYGPGVML